MDKGYVKIIAKGKAREMAKKLKMPLVYYDDLGNNAYYAMRLTHKDWLIIADAGTGKIAIMPSFAEAVAFIANEGKGCFSEKEIQQNLSKIDYKN